MGLDLGIANLTATTFPGITITGAGAPDNIGMSFKHAILGYVTVTEADTFTLMRGKHILKFGASTTTAGTTWRGAISMPATSISRGQFTQNPQNPSTTGAGFADFLLGVPTWTDDWTPADGNRTGNAQLFAQDDFKITPKLTLNLGLRWLQQRGYTEQFNRLGSFDPTMVNPVMGTLGAMWFGGQDGREGLTGDQRDNFDRAWVLRGRPGTTGRSAAVTDSLTTCGGRHVPERNRRGH